MQSFHAALVMVAALVVAPVNAAPPNTSRTNPKATDVDKATVRGGVVSDPLWELEIPRQELESVLMRFVQAYEGGKVDRLTELLAPQVRTEAGLLRRQTLHDEYLETFLGSRLRRMILRNVHWTRANEGNEGVVADADFTSYVTSRRDDLEHQRSGALRFHLGKQGAAWLITELYFSYDN